MGEVGELRVGVVIIHAEIQWKSEPIKIKETETRQERIRGQMH
jgi:hypothetical protein